MKVVIPHGLKTYHKKFANRFTEVFKDWLQLRDEIPEDVAEKLIKLTGYKGKKRGCVLLHFCSSSVDWHTDGSAKSCYIIPVQVGKGWRFVVEGYAKYRKVTMKVGDMIKFNDHDRHGLFRDDTAKSYAIFYTVCFESDY